MTSQDVEFHLEQMIPEIRDLEERQIFTLNELQQIMKKRRNFEFKLKKFKKEINDFTNYIEFEVNLNLLRIKRKQKFKLDSRDTGVTLSDYSLVKRIHVLYQKMIKTFPMEISCYLDYIEWAASVNSTKVLSRTLAQAIQFHSNLAIFWVLAAKWEWDHNQSVSAARILLQRGIRVNPHLQELWIEYFKLEVAWILKLQARRSVLFGNRFPSKQDSADIITQKQEGGDDDPSSADSSINLQELDQERDEKTRKLLQDSISNDQQSVLYDYAIPKAIYKASKSSIQSDGSLDIAFAFLQILGQAGPQALDFSMEIYADVEQLALDCISQSKDFDSKIYDGTKKKALQEKAAKAFHVLCQRNLQPFSLQAPQVADPETSKEKSDDVKKDVNDASFPIALDSVCQEYEECLTRLTKDSPSIALLLLDHYTTLLMSTLFPLVTEDNLLQYIVLKADACFLAYAETCSPRPCVQFYLDWLNTVPSVAQALKSKVKESRGTWMSDTTLHGDIIERGLMIYPNNGALWLEKIKLDKREGVEVDMVAIVGKVGVDEDGLLFWRFYMDSLTANTSADQYDEINSHFEKAIALFSQTTHLFQPLLSQYLTHLFQTQKNSEKAYDIVSFYLSAGRQTSLKYVIKTFVDEYIVLYKTQLASTHAGSLSPQSKHHLTRIEKMWTLLHDLLPNDLDLWVSHISFELSVHDSTGAFIALGGEGASQVYWKALKLVEPAHHLSLEAKYQTLLNA